MERTSCLKVVFLDIDPANEGYVLRIFEEMS